MAPRLTINYGNCMLLELEALYWFKNYLAERKQAVANLIT